MGSVVSLAVPFARLAAIAPPADQLERSRRAGASRGGFIEYEIRLAITLRYLAGGSYLDLIYLYGVSATFFYFAVWDTLKRLNRILPALEDS